MARSGSLLSASSLGCGYASKPVVKGLSLEVQRGQVATLLGPNGCGKSTVLKTLAGLIRPVTGRIFLEGIPMESMRRTDVAAKVAFLPQSEPFTSELIVSDTLSLSQIVRRPYELDINYFIELFELRSLKKTPVSCLSGGQRQRVRLARTFSQQTDVLLLDEPETNLDEQWRQRLQSIIQSCSDRALVIATHDPGLTRAVGAEPYSLLDYSPESGSLSASM